MVLSTETFNQSVRTEYSEAVNARYTFQPLKAFWYNLLKYGRHLQIGSFGLAIKRKIQKNI